ncbi:MAG TPA: hypothetical protein PKK06_09100 [Phycisphaerae bacterium]|nr:hypothetical protein [Phycisphaerae bacterium]HNU45272.1 hypothetical protein [Phycisphaerae bacterium]
MRAGGGSALLGVWLVLAGWAVAGCERRSPPKPASPVAEVTTLAPPNASLSPADVVRRVNEYRQAGRVALIEHYIVPEQRAAILELIQAVDRLLAANEGLRQAVRTHLGSAQVDAFDLAAMANRLGPFSQDVTVLDEQSDGNQASVTIQIAQRLPLESVQLVRVADRWLIRESPPVPGLAGEVHRLAQALVDGAKALREQHWSAARLHAELAARQASVNRRIAALMAARGVTESPPVGSPSPPGG